MTDRFHTPISSRARRTGIALVAALALTLTTLASAHIENQQTQFPDIGASQHKDAIVLLVALDILPQTPTFQPDQPFSRQDLAAWAALAHRKDPGGEAPDVAKLIQDGRSFVDSSSGNATAADINKAIFDGKLDLADPSQTFTHDQAAAFVADHLTPAFVAALGATAGPSGTISNVKTGTSPDGDTSYTLVIAGNDYPVYDHARVVGPTDLTLWQGKQLTRSYQAKEDNGPALTYLVMGQPAAAPTQTSSTAATPQPSSSNPALRWIVGLAVLLVVVAAVAFFRPRKRTP
jgi:hypothetical protein